MNYYIDILFVDILMVMDVSLILIKNIQQLKF